MTAEERMRERAERVCNVCKLLKPISSFPHDRSRTLGIAYRCHECDRNLNKLTRTQNRAHFSRYEKERDPVKKSARGKIQYAAWSGKIERGPCAICGSDNAQAHHHDYRKPFDVVWLCVTHHAAIHRNANA